jgi:hypothetical protein
VTAPPSVSSNDLMHNLGMAGSPSPDLNLVVTQGQGIKVALTGNQAPLDSSQIANRYATISNSGTSTAAPAAGTQIATLSTVSYAYYRADIIVGFGSTAESTANDNFVLKDGATTLATIPVSNIANTMSQAHTLYVNSANGNLSINVGASAGSAGSIYKATIRLTRLV